MDKGLLVLASVSVIVLVVIFMLTLIAKVKMLECEQVFRKDKGLKSL